MAAHETRLVWILVTPAKDVQGDWVSHCLDLDIMSQGNSMEHAIASLYEALQISIRDDLESGLDPFERESAPDECWAPLFETMKHGVPLSSVPKEKHHRIRALALQMSITVEQKDDVEELVMPPVWQRAALERRSADSVRC